MSTTPNFNCKPQSIQYARMALLALLVMFMPSAVAQAATPTTLKELINVFIGIINLLIPLIFVCIFIFLIWKLIDAWILNAADEKKRTEGKSYAIAAVLVFVLAVSTWGIIALLRQSVFGV